MNGVSRRPWSRTVMEALFVLVLIVAAALGSKQLAPRELALGLGKIKDGDSFVLRGKQVRLHGIDAPEYRQTCESAKGKDYPCGKDAAKALRELLRGRNITCTEIERDRYRRSVSVCRNGEVELNKEMVRLGWAIAYRRHSRNYVVAEREAKAAKRGLWSGKFAMPEDYRNQTRPVSGDVSGKDSGLEEGEE
jgi:endonuclease YncB( thermonuclease family)